jgi:hypothetical protein
VPPPVHHADRLPGRPRLRAGRLDDDRDVRAERLAHGGPQPHGELRVVGGGVDRLAVDRHAVVLDDELVVQGDGRVLDEDGLDLRREEARPRGLQRVAAPPDDGRHPRGRAPADAGLGG